MNCKKTRCFLVLSMFVAIDLVLCTTPLPTEPETKTRNKGLHSATIMGIVQDSHQNPIPQVEVSVSSDSAVSSTTDASGLFCITRVSKGSFTLVFTHIDYICDTLYTIDIPNDGDSVTLRDAVILTYIKIKVKGKVVNKQSKQPEKNVGVTIANTPIETTTDDNGEYFLDAIPKDIRLKLVFARQEIGYTIVDNVVPVNDDTTLVDDVSLDSIGAQVSGTVYDSNGTPVPGAIVSAIGNGIVDTADAQGNYILNNVPSGIPDIRIDARQAPSIVPVTNSPTASMTGFNLRSNAATSGMDLYLQPPSAMTNGMKLTAPDMIVSDTAQTVPVQTFPTTTTTTQIQSYEWTVPNRVAPIITPTPKCTIPVVKTVLDTAVLKIKVKAKNIKGQYSSSQQLSIRIKSSKPVLRFVGLTLNMAGIPTDTMRINKGQKIYFKATASDPLGGIDSCWWSFGNGDSIKIGGLFPDGLCEYTYSTAGIFKPVFKVKDKDNNIVSDTICAMVNSVPQFLVNDPYATAVVNYYYRVALMAKDDDNDVVRYTFIDSVKGMTLRNDSLIWRPTTADIGVKKVTIAVDDFKGGKDTLSWNITVSAGPSSIATLDSLTPWHGMFTQPFVKTLMPYSDNVPYLSTSETLRAVTTDRNAIIIVQGDSLGSAATITSRLLVPGERDTIRIEVLAQDGHTKQTYSVAIRRAPSPIATLAGISFSQGMLMPQFHMDSLTYRYTILYNHGCAPTMTAVTVDSRASVLINQTPYISGGAFGPLSLASGESVIDTMRIQVTAQNLTDKRTYTILVRKMGAGLSSLQINPFAISSPDSIDTLDVSPAFNPCVTGYAATIASSMVRLGPMPDAEVGTLQIYLNDTAVTYSGNGPADLVLSQALSQNIRLKCVQANDTTKQFVYNIALSRAAYLDTIGFAEHDSVCTNYRTLDSVNCSPSFAANIFSYTITTYRTKAGLRFVYPDHPGSFVQARRNGVPVSLVKTDAYYTPVDSFTADTQSIEYVVSVQSDDSLVLCSYTLRLNRQNNTESQLTALGFDLYSLSPVFNPDSLSYVLTVPDTASAVHVSTLNAPYPASVSINGTIVKAYDSFSSIKPDIVLVPGNSTMSIVVTAPGAHVKTYIIAVQRQ